jgi:hypothetical protein
MAFEFKDPDVAKKYTPNRESDTKVHVPSGKSVPGQKSVGYSGMLSGITLAAADKAFKSGTNNFKLKPGASFGSAQETEIKNDQGEEEEKG